MRRIALEHLKAKAMVQRTFIDGTGAGNCGFCFENKTKMNPN